MGKTSMTRSVAMLGTLMPCQNLAALIQLLSNFVMSQRAEKGLHDARDVMTPAMAAAMITAPVR